MKHIDEIVENLQKKAKEMKDLGREIRESATSLVVAFIDLADSTLIKEEVDPEEWLGYIYSFIRSVDQVAREVGGTVVKRIGDELMLTFTNVENSEQFLSNIISDASLAEFRYKVALDYGDIFLFRFKPELENDPYGPIVDRCSRIAKLAGPGVVLCSSDYWRVIGDKEKYISVGQIKLKSFREPQALYMRPLSSEVPDTYWEPLIKAIDESNKNRASYKYIPRKFSADFFKSLSESAARPFIASELLNVPKLPFSPQQFEKILLDSDDTLSTVAEYYGYLVEWTGIFNKYKREETYLSVLLDIEGNKRYSEMNLKLPYTMLEIVKEFKKGQHIKVRGILERFFFSFYLNYVDLQLLNSPV